MLISNKLHSFRNYLAAKYTINNTMIKFKTIMNTTLIKKGILYD